MKNIVIKFCIENIKRHLKWNKILTLKQQIIRNGGSISMHNFPHLVSAHNLWCLKHTNTKMWPFTKTDMNSRKTAYKNWNEFQFTSFYTSQLLHRWFNAFLLCFPSAKSIKSCLRSFKHLVLFCFYLTKNINRKTEFTIYRKTNLVQ